MSALDRFQGLEAELATIRDAHARETQDMKDALLAAQIEARMALAALKTAQEDRDHYMRTAVELIGQFSTVEKVFAEAKHMALKMAAQETREREEKQDPVPDFLSKPREGDTRLPPARYRQ